MRDITVETVDWRLAEPFTVSRGTQTVQPTLRVTLRDAAGYMGRGEACPVYYRGETVVAMAAGVGQARPALAAGLDRMGLLGAMPAGAARQAVDAALWDLEAKRGGTTAFALAGVAARPVLSARTIGIRPLAAYREAAARLASWPLLKVKVGAENPLAALKAVRAGAPAARLIVDPNQSWSVAQLRDLAPRLADLGTVLIEQPIAVGDEAGLDGWVSPVPLCADELIDQAADLPKARARFQAINIKLDKSGGLTAGLALARQARAEGFGLMVGCMGGSSLSMAPAMVLAQLCDFVDLDGPLLQADDIRPGFAYANGCVAHPLIPELWG